jgi:hypothetical protein
VSECEARYDGASKRDGEVLGDRMDLVDAVHGSHDLA